MLGSINRWSIISSPSSLSLSLYLSPLSLSLYIYIYIYIHRGREDERKEERNKIIKELLVRWLQRQETDKKLMLLTRRYSTFSFHMLDFGLVWFYGISTIEGYLMPNHFLYK